MTEQPTFADERRFLCQHKGRTLPEFLVSTKAEYDEMIAALRVPGSDTPTDDQDWNVSRKSGGFHEHDLMRKHYGKPDQPSGQEWLAVFSEWSREEAITAYMAHMHFGVPVADIEPSDFKDRVFVGHTRETLGHAHADQRKRSMNAIIGMGRPVFLSNLEYDEHNTDGVSVVVKRKVPHEPRHQSQRLQFGAGARASGLAHEGSMY